MFKNRSVQVKVVKDSPAAISALPSETVSAIIDRVENLFEKYAKRVAVGGVLVYAAVKTIDTTSQVVINKTS
jgi:hypothetical protein